MGLGFIIEGEDPQLTVRRGRHRKFGVNLSAADKIPPAKSSPTSTSPPSVHSASTATSSSSLTKSTTALYISFARPATTSPEAARLTRSVGSAGKAFFVTGWRVGWVIGPSYLIKHVTRAHILICYNSVSPFWETVTVTIDAADQCDHWEPSKVNILRRLSRFNAVWEDLGVHVRERDLRRWKSVATLPWRNG